MKTLTVLIIVISLYSCTSEYSRDEVFKDGFLSVKYTHKDYPNKRMFMKFDSTGNLIEIIKTDHNGNGYNVGYHKSGKIDHFAKIKGHRIDGKMIIFHETGNIKRILWNLNGVTYGHQVDFYQNGNPKLYLFRGYSEHIRFYQKFDSITGDYNIDTGGIIDTIVLINYKEEVLKFMVAQPLINTPTFEMLLFDTAGRLEIVKCHKNKKGEFIFPLDGREFTGLYKEIVASAKYNEPKLAYKGGHYLLVTKDRLIDEDTFRIIESTINQ